MLTSCPETELLIENLLYSASLPQFTPGSASTKHTEHTGLQDSTCLMPNVLNCLAGKRQELGAATRATCVVWWLCITMHTAAYLCHLLLPRIAVGE